MEKIELLMAILALSAFLIYLLSANSKIMRPRYLKPLSFFRMVNDSDLLEYTADNGVKVTVYYAESLFTYLSEGEVQT